MTYNAYPVVDRLTALGGRASVGIDATIDFAGDVFGQMRALLNVWRIERSLDNPRRMTKKVRQGKCWRSPRPEGQRRWASAARPADWWSAWRRTWSRPRRRPAVALGRRALGT